MPVEAVPLCPYCGAPLGYVNEMWVCINDEHCEHSSVMIARGEADFPYRYSVQGGEVLVNELVTEKITRSATRGAWTIYNSAVDIVERETRGE